MMFGQSLNSHMILKRLAKALIRLRVCAGWSEPLLVAHTILLEISCRGSDVSMSLFEHQCSVVHYNVQSLLANVDQLQMELSHFDVVH